jgi:hypothetical protein
MNNVNKVEDAPISFASVENFLKNKSEKSKNILYFTRISQTYLAEIVLEATDDVLFFDTVLKIFKIDDNNFKLIHTELQNVSFNVSRIDKIQSNILNIIDKYEGND